MSWREAGLAISAPPPNPMMARPVARPGRSGNHLIRVDTGEMYPRPRPMPPITPEPRIIIQSWCIEMPMAEITMPPHQHSAATTPALRGPTCSSHPPQRAAAQPRKTKNSVYIQPRVEIFQSQLVVKSSATKLMSAGQAIGFETPSALLNGSQNTEKPYAMPMHRWMARAAGGTSQRL